MTFIPWAIEMTERVLDKEEGMRALEAAEETMRLWRTKKAESGIKLSDELGFEHCEVMLKTMQAGGMSYGKLCRWLGWMQAACVAGSWATLEDMKEVNRRYA